MGVLTHPFDTLVVAACAMGIYYWGAATGVSAHLVRLDAEDGEEEADPVYRGQRPIGVSAQTAR
jgi:hypothetical protein